MVDISSNVDEDLEFLKQLCAKGDTHSTSLAPPSQKRRMGVESIWNCFKEEKRALFEQPNFTPDANVYKVFFRWYAKKAKGLFGPRPTIGTVLATLGIFSSIVGLQKSVIDEIKGFITGPLDVELDLRNESRSKRLFMAPDMELLHDFLFCRDSHKYAHSRYRVQIALDDIMLLSSAARPGAIDVSSGYRGSNQALRYNDLKLVLKRPPDNDPSPDRTPRFWLDVTFRLMKGARHNSSSFIKITLKENRARPLCCPITMFMALAFGDNAFEHFRCPKDLISHSMPADSKKIDITIKPELLFKPIFRMVENKQISPDKAWTCECSSSLRRNLGVRAGFRYNIRPYDIRRGSANIIHAIATESQRNQLLGHNNNKVFNKSYLSQHVLLDVQGYVDNGHGEDGHIKQLMSQSIDQRDDAPSHPPKTLLTEVGNDQGLEGLRRTMNEAWQYFREAIPGVFYMSHFAATRNLTKRRACRDMIKAHIDDVVRQKQVLELFDNAHDAVRAYANHRRRLIDHKFTAYREDWFKQANTRDALYQPTTTLATTQTAVASSSPLPSDNTLPPAIEGTLSRPSPSPLEKWFHPVHELKFLSLELIEALALDCDPQKQLRKNRLSPKRPKTQEFPDRTPPHSLVASAVETPRAKRMHSVMLEKEAEAGRHSSSPIDGHVEKGRHSSQKLDEQIEEGRPSTAMPDMPKVKQKRRSVVAGAKRKAERPIAAEGTSKAKRVKVGKKKLNRVPEEECPAIPIGYIEWDEVHNKWRTIYYDEK